MNTWFLDRLIFSDTSATHSHKHIVNLAITSKIMDLSISLSNYSFPHFLLYSYLPLGHSRASSFFLFFCPLHFSGLAYPAYITSFQHPKLSLLFFPQNCMNPNMPLWLPVPRNLSPAGRNHTTGYGQNWCNHKHVDLSSPESSTQSLSQIG